MRRQAVGPFFKNGFVVGCEETREAVLIDPGDEVATLLAFAERRALAIRHILLTHAHVDHVTGVAAAKRALGVPVYLHRDDLFLYDRAVEIGRDVRAEGRAAAADRSLSTRRARSSRSATTRSRPHHTPGHCPGGVCLQIGQKGETGEDLFVGDTLFAGSIGRTDLPGGDYEMLIASIRDVLFPFGDDAIVHPGHGPTRRSDTSAGPTRFFRISSDAPLNGGPLPPKGRPA